MSKNISSILFFWILLISCITTSCYKQKPPYSTFTQVLNYTNSQPSNDSSEFIYVYKFKPRNEILKAKKHVIQFNSPFPHRVTLNNKPINEELKKGFLAINNKIINGFNLLKISIAKNEKGDSTYTNNYLPPKIIGYEQDRILNTELTILESDINIALIKTLYELEVSNSNHFKFRIGNVSKDTFLEKGNHSIKLILTITNPKKWETKKSPHTYKLYSQVFTLEKTISDTVLYLPIRSMDLNTISSMVNLNNKELILNSTNLEFVLDTSSYQYKNHPEKIITNLSNKDINSIYYRYEGISTKRIEFFNYCAYYGIIPIEIK